MILALNTPGWHTYESAISGRNDPFSRRLRLVSKNYEGILFPFIVSKKVFTREPEFNDMRSLEQLIKYNEEFLKELHSINFMNKVRVDITCRDVPNGPLDNSIQYTVSCRKKSDLVLFRLCSQWVS